MLGDVPVPRRYAFHKGKLFIEECQTVMMVNPWPDPWARSRRGVAGRWQPALPRFQVVTPVRRLSRQPAAQLELGLNLEPAPSATEKRRIALARFRSRLPKRVARAVESVRGLQWQHLVACAMSHRFVELLESNPVLGYLWIRVREAKLDPASVAAATELPQRELLGQLGMLNSKAAVKFLRKCYAPALSLEIVEALRGVMGNEESLARLRHLGRAGSGVIALARFPRLLDCCSPSLLDEVARCKQELYRAPTAMRLENHLEMCAQLDLELRRPFRSRLDLHHAHRELVREYQSRRQRLVRPSRHSFGLPPLVGSQTIQPLTTAAALRREGEEQDNCVASYAGRVHGGSHYIYRVTWPERCTLSIVKGPDGRWRRGELEVAHNRPASRRSCEVIDAWLKSGQRLLKLEE